MSALSLLDSLATATAVASAPAPVPPVWRWASKWGYFVGLAALVGSPVVHLLVVRPALRAHAVEATERRGRLAMHRIIGLSAVLFAVSFVFQLASVTARGLKVDYAEAFAPPVVWRYLTQPPKGEAWFGAGTTTLAQTVLVVVVLALLVPRLWSGPGRSAELAVAVAAPLTVLVTLVKSVPSGPDALAADELVGRLLVQGHIVAGSVWVGGLAALAALTRSRSHVRDAGVDVWTAVWQRFSVLAMAGVGVLLVSGAWLTWQEVGTPAQLLTTPFGRLLAVKMLLVAALLGFGGWNQLVLLPRIVRLRRSGETAPAHRLAVGHLGRIVLAESVVGVLVLLVVGLLSGSAREQAGTAEAVVDWPVYAWGSGFAVAVVALFAGTAKVASVLAARPGGKGAAPAAGTPA